MRSTAAAGDISAEGDVDGYPNTELTYAAVATKIGAVISAPTGTFVQGGTLQEVMGFRLAAEVCDLQHSDRVLDEHDQQVYVVKWCHNSKGFGLDHVSAEIRQVEGFQ